MPSSKAGWKSPLWILSNGGAWNGSVLGVANGLVAFMAVATLTVDVPAGRLAAGAGVLSAAVSSVDECEQAARAIDVATTSRRRRSMDVSLV